MVRFTPSNGHSLAGTPSLPGITCLRGVVHYHGVVGRLAHTMVKVSQKCRRYGFGVTCDRGWGPARGRSPYPLPGGLIGDYPLHGRCPHANFPRNLEDPLALGAGRSDGLLCLHGYPGAAKLLALCFGAL